MRHSTHLVSKSKQYNIDLLISGPSPQLTNFPEVGTILGS